MKNNSRFFKNITYNENMSALSKWQSLYSIVLDDAVELFDHDKKKTQKQLPST